jgi:DNA-directed RNA polymerase specialized sigma24 family protein
MPHAGLVTPALPDKTPAGPQSTDGCSICRAQVPEAGRRGAVKVTFDERLPVAGGRHRDLVTIDEALEALAKVARKSRIVELRFFGGLGVKEAARVLKVSPDTVMRDWKPAKTWAAAGVALRKSE